VRLVDDLLDVSRISRGKLELRVQPTTLQQCITEALEASQAAIEAAGHALSVDLPEQPLALHGDVTRLAQVVSNLVNNSVQVHAAGRACARQRQCGGGTGRGAGERRRVRHLRRHAAARVRPVRAGRRGAPAGAGRPGHRPVAGPKLVEMHHGTIEAHSRGRDQGSTFTVRLPLASPPEG
jgi:signal transduction histidine kinase